MAQRSGLEVGHLFPWGYPFTWGNIFKLGAFILCAGMYFPVLAAARSERYKFLWIPTALALVSFALTVVFLSKDNPDEAKIKEYIKAVQASPQDHGAYELLANAYVVAKQYDKAVQVFGKALELTPDPSYVLHDRGLVQARAGHYNEAIADLNKAMEFRADQPDFIAKTYNDLAVVHYYFHKYALSAQDAAKARDMGLELAPDFVDALAKKGFPLPAASLKDK
jgi:tetratricopeptide (TPR) repeat protein